MSGPALLLLCIIIISATLVPGIVFIHYGKTTKNYGFLIAGWILVGSISTAVTFGLGYLIYESPSAVYTLLAICSPFLVFAGLIFTLAAGICFVIKGFYRDKDGTRPFKKSLITGWVLIGINITIVSSIILLLALLATGIIPISFM